MLSNIVRSYCYLHCTCSMSKNWMAMMNQHYQAKQLMKRLQNNRKKSCQIQEITKRAHMLPFHSGLCTVRLSFLLMFLHKLTSLEVRCPFCNVLSQDQCWPLRFDNMKLNSKKMTTTRSNHFLTERSNQLKSHSQLYSLFFKWCVNLCYCVNQSYQIIR